MPIGSAKIGVLGAGLVPGGTQTFNASGTFTVPPGVKKVNIVGKGSPGNPGNPGNAGNSGNPGKGGSGAGGGGKRGAPCVNAPGASQSGVGGSSLSGNQTFPLGGSCVVLPGISAVGGKGVIKSTTLPSLFSGAYNAANPACSPGATAASGTTGGTGPAGSAGSAGSAGNPGNASSGLCKTFPGGAGGTAGNAGAAGNGGTGGGGGGGGTSGNPTNIPGWCTGPGYGTGGNPGSGGGGVGGPGTCTVAPNNWKVGGTGGGGAGVANDGGSGLVWNSATKRSCGHIARGPIGGTNNSFCVPISPTGYGTCPSNRFVEPAMPTNVTGGAGGYGQSTNNVSEGHGGHVFNVYAKSYCGTYGRSCAVAHDQFSFCGFTPNNPTISSWANSSNNPVYRSGAGGGGGMSFASQWSSGGGGGGGRGNAGNAGGSGGTGGAGSAANPTTFNCVPVTPGSPYPVTVASPGGQVVISWNPQ